MREKPQGESRAFHRYDERRHAEQRPVPRISLFLVQLTLAERARRRYEHRLMRAQ
jgi:hypothetical protein